MIYYLDFSENGKRCEITIKGLLISCKVDFAHVRINKKGIENKKYSLIGNDKCTYENISEETIKFMKHGKK
jgi:hypothetical protein